MENEIIEESVPEVLPHYEVASYLKDGRRVVVKFLPMFSFTDNPIASVEYAENEDGSYQMLGD